MPANWTTPITWNVDQLVTNTDLNQQLRDNLDYLLSPNHERIIRDNSGDAALVVDDIDVALKQIDEFIIGRRLDDMAVGFALPDPGIELAGLVGIVTQTAFARVS